MVLYAVDQGESRDVVPKSFRASASRNSLFALARLDRSLRWQAGDGFLLAALGSGVLQNEVSPLEGAV